MMNTKTFTTLFILCSVLPLLMLIFPLFEIANRATPIIIGLPFSFFWVILWIVINFVLLLILYRFDPDKEEEGDA